MTTESTARSLMSCACFPFVIVEKACPVASIATGECPTTRSGNASHYAEGSLHSLSSAYVLCRQWSRQHSAQRPFVQRYLADQNFLPQKLQSMEAATGLSPQPGVSAPLAPGGAGELVSRSRVSADPRFILAPLPLELQPARQVPIDATAKHNPGLRISPSVTARVRRHLHENLREIDIAMPGGLYPFCGPAGSDRFASTPRSRARGGQFARGLFQSVPPVNAKYSKDPKIRVRSSSGGRCSRI